MNKGEENLRLCIDFSVTVNKHIDTEHYPLLQTEDVFAKLAGVKIFTFLDVSRVFQHLEAEDSSKHLLTIITHLSLFLFNKLPFGVSSAPSIFQAVMDKILHGIPGVNATLMRSLSWGRQPRNALRQQIRYSNASNNTELS